MIDETELGVAIDRIIDTALAEDLASGDVTSRCTVPPDVESSAQIIAKQDLVVAGLPVARRVFEKIDASIEIEIPIADGQRVAPRDELMRLHGNARNLLAAERTALNLLQRACGVATLTRQFVDAAGDRLKITDTRKTMPGLRALDRYAVRRGGGHNHRNDLGGGVLIKENHIRAAGGVRAAVTAAKAGAPHGLRIECEVTTIDEVQEAKDAGADVLLLDNMDDVMLAEAVRVADGQLILEASGGMTLERVPGLGEIGVHLASVGALTHSAVAVDISMLFALED